MYDSKGLFNPTYIFLTTVLGLIGPLIVCKKGSLEASGLPKGYDEQRFLLMGIMDENKSWYLDRNMKYCTASSCGGISKGKCVVQVSLGYLLMMKG